MIHIWKSLEDDVAVNMAIESWLLKENGESHVLFWRNTPSIVIGRNQIPWKEANIDSIYRDGLILARRLSGGGAVYHDQGNLNISFIHSGKKEQNFKRVKDALNSLGISCEVGSRGEISTAYGKVSGSAYYFYKGRFMHHMTLLIDADLENVWRYLIKVPHPVASRAVDSVRQSVGNLTQSIATISAAEVMKAIANQCGTLSVGTIDKNTHPSIADFQREFSTWQWIYGQTPDFEVSHEKYLVKVSRGRVESVTVSDKAESVSEDGSLDSIALGKTYHPAMFKLQTIKEDLHVF